MKWRVTLCAAALVAVSSAAQAQGWWWVGGGISPALGSGADTLKMGWMATAGLGMNLKASPAWSLQLEGLYGSSPLKPRSGSSTKMAIMGNVGYDLWREAEFHPYVFAGAGWMSIKAEGAEADNDLAYQAGAGFSYKLGAKTNAWVDWRYLRAGAGVASKSAPLMAGLTFNFGTP
jgi:opacity protein-like surface antigen